MDRAKSPGNTVEAEGNSNETVVRIDGPGLRASGSSRKSRDTSQRKGCRVRGREVRCYNASRLHSAETGEEKEDVRRLWLHDPIRRREPNTRRSDAGRDAN